MYKRSRETNENPFAHLFEKLKLAHKHYGNEQLFTPLDVLAMLHLAMPKGLGWDVAYALGIKAGSTRDEAQASLEKLRQLTMKLGSTNKVMDVGGYEDYEGESLARKFELLDF